MEGIGKASINVDCPPPNKVQRTRLEKNCPAVTSRSEDTPDALYEKGVAQLTGSVKYIKNIQLAITNLQRAVDAGHIPSIECLGGIYRKGLYGFAEDDKKALAVYEKGATLNHVASKYWVGLISIRSNELRLVIRGRRLLHPMLEDQLVRPDTKKDICYELAISYVSPCVPRLVNSGKGFRLFIQAAELGCVDSCYAVGMMAYRGEKVPRDYEIAVKHFEMAHQKGYWKATRFLSECYDAGNGVKMNKEMSLKLLTGIPQQTRNGLDWFNIGAAYSYGEGVRRNTRVAFSCFVKGARQRCRHAMVEVGLGYLYGTGVTEDLSKAEPILRSLNTPKALFHLGLMTIAGKIPEKDGVSGIALVERAKEGDSVEAVMYLARMYREGRIVQRNHRRAYELYARAIGLRRDLHLPWAMMAICTANGEGVERDLKHAVILLKYAMDRGSKLAGIVAGRILIEEIRRSLII